MASTLVYPFLTPALPQHHHRPIRRHYPPPPPWSAFSVNDLFRWKHEPFTIATTQSFQSNQFIFLKLIIKGDHHGLPEVEYQTSNRPSYSS
uniref:Uncharacterized protein n=1 Tax=Lactuca sativa TaxID=4236 RepID=A0A9R1V0D3_LACSA|nr:hypothetical protein LSAT_V11C700343900 [Lactuca sativa]